MTRFLKTTLVGGVLFLLPLAIVLMLLGYALKLASTVAQPISEQLQLQHWGVLGGVGIVTVLSALVLVVVSFAAGLAARTYSGERMTRWFEGSLLGRLPQYQNGEEHGGRTHPARKRYRHQAGADQHRGRLADGLFARASRERLVECFLPQAPTPMSGNVMYFPADRVKPLNITMVEAMSIIKRIGVGSGDALRGADLKQPPGQ